MKYKIKFIGRQIGAIGKFYNHTVIVEANSEEEARLKLYDKFEHISMTETIALKETN